MANNTDAPNVLREISVFFIIIMEIEVAHVKFKPFPGQGVKGTITIVNMSSLSLFCQIVISRLHILVSKI